MSEIERLIRRDEVLECLGISATSLWRLQRSGAITPIKIGRRILYRRREIERFLERATTRKGSRK